MSNIPVGAENDPNAPYNEVDYTREFSISLSGDWTISSKPNLSEDEIKRIIQDQLYRQFNRYIIDDVYISES